MQQKSSSGVVKGVLEMKARRGIVALGYVILLIEPDLIFEIFISGNYSTCIVLNVVLES